MSPDKDARIDLEWLQFRADEEGFGDHFEPVAAWIRRAAVQLGYDLETAVDYGWTEDAEEIRQLLAALAGTEGKTPQEEIDDSTEPYFGGSRTKAPKRKTGGKE